MSGALRAAALLLLLAGCAPPAPCPTTIVAPHVVTPTTCAVLELELDGGITKTICLTGAQLEKAIAAP